MNLYSLSVFYFGLIWIVTLYFLKILLQSHAQHEYSAISPKVHVSWQHSSLPLSSSEPRALFRRCLQEWNPPRNCFACSGAKRSPLISTLRSLTKLEIPTMMNKKFKMLWYHTMNNIIIVNYIPGLLNVFLHVWTSLSCLRMSSWRSCIVFT